MRDGGCGAELHNRMKAIGIDVGGTKILGGIVDVATGQVERELRQATMPERGGDVVLSSVVAMASELAGEERYAVGIGLCELVDNDGKAIDAYRIDWRGLDVPVALASVGPALVESDVRAAALAEARFGAGRASPTFLYVTVGTGISHTLVIDGEPYSGGNGRALVLGAPQVEHIASGPALAKSSRVLRAEDALTPPNLSDAVAHAADALGAAIAFLVHALDPPLVVIGGGLGLNERYRNEVAVAALRLIEFDPAPAIVPAQTGEYAGTIGAATRVIERLGEEATLAAAD
jgi:glucokinase